MPNKNDKLLLAISCLKGGGAERVITQLANAFYEKGYDTRVMATNTRREDIYRGELSQNVSVIQPERITDTGIARFYYPVLGVYARFFCKIFEALHMPVPAHFAYASFVWQYHNDIAAVRKILKAEPEMPVIAFLQPTVPIVLLAARGLPNRIVISERGDSHRLMKGRYGRQFAKKYYKRADRIVFQSEGAMQGYPSELHVKGYTIPNPLKAGLPKPHVGPRDKRIVTFCRISAHKNLPMLLDAFGKFSKQFPAYSLHIYGDTQNAADEQLLAALHEQLCRQNNESRVVFHPFSARIHDEILSAAMYVNSSDHEGMSNAMLEAMAIGLPSICTDCPAGGARAIIRDHENGILVPVGDADAMYKAMCEVADDAALAEHMSLNGQKLREELSLEQIAAKWEALLK